MSRISSQREDEVVGARFKREVKVASNHFDLFFLFRDLTV